MNIKNKVQLIGRLGNAPEIKSFGEKGKLAKMNIATNEVFYNNKGEKTESTQWHNVIAWGKQAEIIETYIEKGQEVLISGKLIHRNYEDKEGVKRYITEVQADNVLMLGKK